MFTKHVIRTLLQSADEYEYINVSAKIETNILNIDVSLS